MRPSNARPNNNTFFEDNGRKQITLTETIALFQYTLQCMLLYFYDFGHIVNRKYKITKNYLLFELLDNFSIFADMEIDTDDIALEIRLDVLCAICIFECIVGIFITHA